MLRPWHCRRRTQNIHWPIHIRTRTHHIRVYTSSSDTHSYATRPCRQRRVSVRLSVRALFLSPMISQEQVHGSPTNLVDGSVGLTLWDRALVSSSSCASAQVLCLSERFLINIIIIIIIVIITTATYFQFADAER